MAAEEAKGITVTSGTEISTARAPVASMLSRTSSYWAVKVLRGVTIAGLPGLGSRIAPSTSLAPMNTDTNVGSSRCINSSWVRPPRMNCLYTSVTDGGEPKLLSSSPTVAPGKLTLLIASRVGWRRLQPLAAPLRTRCWVTLLSSGAGHPLPRSGWSLNNGMLKLVPMASASRLAYERT
jgi:hypothetical protein